MNWRQQKDEPLFPNLLWSRPENKRSAGKLLIIGGQAGEFKNVSECYAAAEQAGAGTVRLLLPESLRKLTQHLPAVEYSSATASGGFAQTALSDFLDLPLWADHILLAGDFGKNSQTTILLEKFLEKNSKSLTIASSALDSIDPKKVPFFSRSCTFAGLSLPQLQKIGIALKVDKIVTSSMPVQLLADTLAGLSAQNDLNIVLMHDSFGWAMSGGEVVSTPAGKTSSSQLAAYCAVWQMQHPCKTIEALATACWCAISDSSSS